MEKKRLFICILLLGLMSLMVLAGRQTAYAKETGNFSGDVSVLKAEDDAYVLQVQVRNTGEDFDGTVRLSFSNTDISCVFDTRITLPRDGQKQYTLTVPRENADSIRGNGALYFLDGDENELQKVTFKNIFKGQSIGVSVGILSDHPDKLTYMDMGGNGYYIGSISQPINLVELDKDNLKDSLDGLYFLVIDSYNVSTLDTESMTAIQEWVSNGGGLIIGTGERGEDTLNAFDGDFIGLKILDIRQAGEDNYLVSSGGQMYYDFYEMDNIDFHKMAVAQLQPSGNASAQNFQETGSCPGMVGTYGNGGIMVLALSLCEDEMQKASSDLCQEMYNAVVNISSSIAVNYNDDFYYRQLYAFGLIDQQNTNVSFTWLEVVIFIYVVLAGPVLYLILAKAKKREWYWIGAPALALVFIGGVLVFGRNLRVADTRVYSVTMQRVDGKEQGKTNTLFAAYHSGVKPWELKLKDQYDYAGSKINWGYSGSSGDWRYRVVYEDGIKIGMKPESNFETGYLYAFGSGGADCGKISTQNLTLMDTMQTGQITNNTNYDFPYMAVYSDSCVMIVKDVKKGETMDLAGAIKDNRVVYQSSDMYLDDLYYNMRRSGLSEAVEDENDLQLCAALLIGTGDAGRKYTPGNGQAIVCGVVADYDQAVDDKCTEISFGCLYAIVEQEVRGASN